MLVKFKYIGVRSDELSYYVVTKIAYCCEAIARRHLFYKELDFRVDDKKFPVLHITGLHGTDVQYCPFCGTRIEFKEEC